MHSLRNSLICFVFLTIATAAYGQLGINLKPSILGQVTLTTYKETPITIKITDLTIIDLNDLDHSNFTIQLYEGQNYTFEGSTVTPNAGYLGDLKVPITVNDGQDNSNKFSLKISVLNFKPVITGQRELSTPVDQPLIVEFEDLIVKDADNDYPEDFTMKLASGRNYEVKDNTVIPDKGYTGTLTVVTTVKDGDDESNKFGLEIEVLSAPNVPPDITGQNPLSVEEEKSIVLKLEDLKVTDPDDKYPTGFTLKVEAPGSNAKYTLLGTTVTPVKDFTGPLSVNVTVSDGKDESNVYPLQIAVTPINDPPVITGQKALTTNVDTPIKIEFEDLLVTDVDNIYPNGFTMKIADGTNYSVEDRTITPAKDYKGTLKAKVTVNDGTISSAVFELQIKVILPVNIAPVITAQTKTPVITQNSSLLIQLDLLEVTDPDNKYPTGFKLTVKAGTNYTFSGTTITPAKDFLGTLTVPVFVNDGLANSNTFSLKVNVVEPTARPQIIGQRSLFTEEDSPITIKPEDLIVSDADDTYPTGFTLLILDGPGYTKNGTTVTPAKDLNGFLTVIVKVKDKDGNESDPFNLAILINPVNDAPVITQFETETLSYDPGREPVVVTMTFEVEDVDDDHLSFAEIRIDSQNYKQGNDELLFTNTPSINGVFNASTGKLSLVGYAELAEYITAIRAVRYNYALTQDESGNQEEIPSGTKKIFVTVHDSQLPSETRQRIIKMETSVVLQIPTAFTPNDDKTNETWGIKALSNEDQCKNAVVKIYNRKGILLFQATGISTGWDGRLNGQLLPTDTYYYTIDLNLSYAKKTYRGVVTLLR